MVGFLSDALPALRQDLALHPGAAASDGSPTWTLHDPSANRFFQLTWAAFELLSRWHLKSAAALIEAVSRETTLRVGPNDVEALLRMLTQSHLLVAQSNGDSKRLLEAAQMSRQSAWQWLLKNYLFMRIPLLRPMGLLEKLSPWVRFAYRPAFWWSVMAVALLGLGMAARRWDEFTHTLVSYADWRSAMAIAAALGFAKILHEMGHALTAYRYGCRVPSMGVALMVMLPVLYTDTNEAWKLTSRRKRLAIGAAGMAVEIALAAAATLAWSLLPATPDWAPLRSAVFLLATSAWVMTLAINASPFMRFDGYFLLSDALNMPNLHERAFAQGRWFLRRQLFGWQDAPPEGFSAKRRAFLIAFAWATWLYRLVLFFGIALLVYHLFFKALGILMLAVEIGWFIAMPVWRELKAWWARRADLHWNRYSMRSVTMLFTLTIGACWPWQAAVHAPAVLGAQQAQAVHAPYSAQVETVSVKPGQNVRAGEVLMVLRSPALEAQSALAQLREQQLQWQLQQQSFDAQLMEAGPALRKRFEAAAEEVAGMQRELQRLTLTAPFEGTVVDMTDDVSAGSWLAAGERVLHVVAAQGAKVDAYVDETSLQTLSAAGEGAVFIPNAVEAPALRCSQVQVDAVQLTELDQPAVANTFGGSMAVQQARDGRLIPLQPTFRVRLQGCEHGASARMEMAGVAVLQGESRSWLGAGFRCLMALWQRESLL